MATDESAAKIMTEKYPSLVEASLRTPPDEKGIWLVRPDGYVAVVAHDGDWKTIEAALSRIALWMTSLQISRSTQPVSTAQRPPFSGDQLVHRLHSVSPIS